MIDIIEALGYGFIALVLFVLGYAFVKLFAAGLTALTENDD
jgi:hypothetical protein